MFCCIFEDLERYCMTSLQQNLRGGMSAAVRINAEKEHDIAAGHEWKREKKSGYVQTLKKHETEARYMVLETMKEAMEILKEVENFKYKYIIS
jgi:hypothetical protein